MPDDIVAQAKFYLPVCNGYNMVVATEQHVNGNFTFFYYFPDFHVTSFPVHCVHGCSCQRTQINQMQIKTKASSTAMKVERKLSFYQKALLNVTFR